LIYLESKIVPNFDAIALLVGGKQIKNQRNLGHRQIPFFFIQNLRTIFSQMLSSH